VKRFKLLSTLLAKAVVRTAFCISSAFLPVNPRKVTFASYRSSKLEGNLYWVYRELASRGERYKYTFLFRKYKSSFGGKLGFLWFMAKAGHHLATSKYFLVDDYFFPIYVITPRRNTQIVQLWHAAGAFKKFGYSTLDKDYGPSEEYLKHVKIHSNYSLALVSSTEVVPHFAEAFNMPPERILPLGIPRTDYFFLVEEHERIKLKFAQLYPQLKGKKLILYAPTFRGKSYGREPFHCPIDTAELYRTLGQDYAFIVHLHPYLKDTELVVTGPSSFVYRIEDEFDIQELMILADILITDYSSVIFDYSLLGKPMAFFATDLDEYLAERDFYYDYRTLIPGPLFTDVKELASWIMGGDFDLEAVARFRDRFFDVADGQASRRVVDYIFGPKASGAH
jgi:CDP-glycerol glycerophosphotransferase (TagB/SpsB family)